MSSNAPHALERYRLGPSLGRGGQGNTYEAVDVALGRPVAVKLVTLRGSEWKRFELFERECEVLKQLDHPGIPRYLDTFADESAGHYALVMEKVEGRSLQQLLDDGRLLSEARIWSVIDQALGIIAYLHGLHPPVIHRDIKPANLMLGTDDKLSLVDFGGVRVALRPEGGSTVVGTFGYMAPEQLHGEATPATDIFSLGATIAALLTGRDADKLPRKGLKIDLDQLLTAGPLRDVLTLMLEPEPAQRPSSALVVRRLIADLRHPAPARGAALSRLSQSTRSAPAAGLAGTSAGASPGAQVDSGQGAAGSEALAPRPSSAAQSGALVPADELQSRDAGARMALGIAGTLGWALLSVGEFVMLPVIVALLAALWGRKPEKRARLDQRAARVRSWLSGGRESMQALRESRQLPAATAPPARRLPPHDPSSGAGRFEQGHSRRPPQADERHAPQRPPRGRGGHRGPRR